MGQICFCLSCPVVNDTAQLSASGPFEIANGQFCQVVKGLSLIHI